MRVLDTPTCRDRGAPPSNMVTIYTGFGILVERLTGREGLQAVNGGFLERGNIPELEVKEGNQGN